MTNGGIVKTPAPAILACLVALTGCVTKYVAPTGGETATLTMETVDPQVRNLWFYRYSGNIDEYCRSAIPAEGIAILNNVSVASGYADGGKNMTSATTTIPAGQPFRFATQLPTYEPRGGVLHLTWCQPHASFTPEPGRAGDLSSYFRVGT